MRILLMSDITWHDPVSYFASTYPVDYLKIHQSRIIQLEPDVIIFAGDSIYDGGFVNRSHFEKFLTLLKFLNESKIQTFIIEGNHDNDDQTYESLKKKLEWFPFVHEISGKCVNYHNLKIVGIPYGSEKDAASQLKMKDFDIVIAHPDFSNRTFLFELNTKFLICGHCDNFMGKIFNTLLITLNGNYAVIEYEKEKSTISYYTYPERFHGPKIRKADLINGKLVWLKGTQKSYERKYIKQIKLLLKAKQEIENLDKNEQIKLINKMLSEGISKRQIEYYIGKKRLLYNYADSSKKKRTGIVFTSEEKDI